MNEKDRSFDDALASTLRQTLQQLLEAFAARAAVQ
jgi:hypothetical protein